MEAKSPAGSQFIFKETGEQHNNGPENAIALGDSSRQCSFNLTLSFCHTFIKESHIVAVKHSKTHGEDIIVKQFWLEGHSILATH